MAIREYPDGRVVRIGKSYTDWRKWLYLCTHECELCGKFFKDISEMEIHHKDGRGMGGGKRDDRHITENGNCICICKKCHRRKHK